MGLSVGGGGEEPECTDEERVGGGEEGEGDGGKRVRARVCTALYVCES